MADEVTVVLAGDHNRVLSPEEGKAVIDAFDSVKHEATKWRLKTGRGGRLLIIEPRLISEIEAFLDAPGGEGC